MWHIKKYKMFIFVYIFLCHFFVENVNKQINKKLFSMWCIIISDHCILIIVSRSLYSGHNNFIQKDTSLSVKIPIHCKQWRVHFLFLIFLLIIEVTMDLKRGMTHSLQSWKIMFANPVNCFFIFWWIKITNFRLFYCAGTIYNII